MKSTIHSIKASAKQAEKMGIEAKIDLYLIDNGPDEKNLNNLTALQSGFKDSFNTFQILTGHGNIGYGQGNNLAINRTTSQYHLILNPDVILDINALPNCLKHMKKDESLGLAAPLGLDNDNNQQFLAKRFPNPLVLALRFLNITPLNRLFKKQLDNYEYRDRNQTQESFEIELASGCFMLCRTAALKAIGGFTESYFLYFEDFDLSVKLKKNYKVAHFPDIKILHYGGMAGRKGFRHALYFTSSAIKFYYHHFPSLYKRHC